MEQEPELHLPSSLCCWQFGRGRLQVIPGLLLRSIHQKQDTEEKPGHGSPRLAGQGDWNNRILRERCTWATCLRWEEPDCREGHKGSYLLGYTVKWGPTWAYYTLPAVLWSSSQLHHVGLFADLSFSIHSSWALWLFRIFLLTQLFTQTSPSPSSPQLPQQLPLNLEQSENFFIFSSSSAQLMVEQFYQNLLCWNGELIFSLLLKQNNLLLHEGHF